MITYQIRVSVIGAVVRFLISRPGRLSALPSRCFPAEISSAAFFFSAFMGVFFADAAAAESAVKVDSVGVYLMQQRYTRAQELLLELRGADPTDVDALYSFFTVRQTEILDYESYAVHGDRFVVFIDSALAVIEKAVADGRRLDSARCLFYLGNLHGGKSIILAKNNKWFSAVKPAARSVALLNEALMHDSTFRAPLLGVGLFNYYLSQNLGWIPFMKDRTEEGLRNIEAATAAEFPYNYAAMNTFCWILIERQEYLRADSIASTVLREFPQNTIFLRIKTRTELARGLWEDALADGIRLRDLTTEREDDRVNWSDLLMAHQVIVTAYRRLGRTKEALETAREGLSLKVPPWALEINHVQDHRSYLAQFVQSMAEERR